MRNYATIEARNRALETALFAPPDETLIAERHERYAGLLRVQRGPAAYRITFPEFKARYADTRPILIDVKAIPGRRFDALSQSWTVPADQAQLVELIAETYGTAIEELAGCVHNAGGEGVHDAQGVHAAELRNIESLVVELRKTVIMLTEERNAAVRLADEYAAALETPAAASSATSSVTSPALYGFRFEQAADGWRFVKQRHENGETIDARISEQSAYRFGTWEEARDAGLEWERGANERAAAYAEAVPF